MLLKSKFLGLNFETNKGESMETKNISIIKFNNGEKTYDTDNVIVEYPLSVYINGAEFISLLCSPKSLKELVAGFLFYEGIINDKKDFEEIIINYELGRADVYTRNKDLFYYEGSRLNAKRTVTTACGGQKSIAYNVMEFIGTDRDKIKTQLNITPAQILDLSNRFNKKSELYLSTGGAHSCALCDPNDFLIFEEDIGRHNALDKILGKAFLEDMALEDKIIFASGRISSEMLIKVVKSKIPVLVSRSAPTDIAIEMAKKYNLTLIGFARGRRMNVYSGSIIV